MDSMILACSFAAAIVIAAGVVLVFTKSIDEALSRVIPPEMEPAWSKYVKFGLFTVTFAGGMRLTDFAELVAQHGPSQAQIGAGQGLLEVFKTIAGSLIAASGALLVFFVATLAVYAASRFYVTHRASIEKAAAQLPHATERPAAAAPQRPVGSERHAAVRERHLTAPDRHPGTPADRH